MRQGQAGECAVWLGPVRVMERVIGYTKKNFLTEKVLEQRPLELPVQVR